MPPGLARLLRTASDVRRLGGDGRASPPLPSGVLLADPAHFDVVSVQNPHMEGQVGKVDREAARWQWESFRETLASLNLEIHVLPADLGLPDLVFTANPSLPFAGPDGSRHVLLSKMLHESRSEEVAHHERFYRERGVTVHALQSPGPFEGCGDALLVPGRPLLLGGHGFRTDPAVYEEVSTVLGVPVALLPLADPAFYHLDTALMPLGSEEALWVPDAFANETRALVRALFPELIAADAEEARTRLAANAIAVPEEITGQEPAVVLDAQCPRTAERLLGRGYRPVLVETGEFLKSGGSAFCLKNWVW
ncbi:MAG: hypothetical protein L0216_19040 [Planctomycetales bacterium]|nr:hypothetical protein [Planctomycetales bacterium]